MKVKQIPLNTDKEGCCSCLKAGYYKMGGANFLGHSNDGFKATCIMEIKESKAVSYTRDCVYEPQVLTPKRTEFGKAVRSQYENGELDISRHDMTTMEPRNDSISNTITTVQKDNILMEPTCAAMRGRNPENTSERDRSNGNYKQMLELNRNGTSNTLTSVQKDNILLTPYRIRKLTPRECFRLMDVDESDIDKLLDAGISNSRLYKLAGNSICVGVLYQIFRKLFVEVENENQQLTLF